jgi:hypothetical protein
MHDIKTWREDRWSSTISLTLAPYGGDQSTSRPGHWSLYSQRKNPEHGWVSPRTGLDISEKRKIPDSKTHVTNKLQHAS